eukprot:10362109-Heterocapsa_arctica.AAC.1
MFQRSSASTCRRHRPTVFALQRLAQALQGGSDIQDQVPQLHLLLLLMSSSFSRSACRHRARP